MFSPSLPRLISLQGGVFGVAGKFPPSYMGSVMAGQAMGGIFPALVDIAAIGISVPAKDLVRTNKRGEKPPKKTVKNTLG